MTTNPDETTRLARIAAELLVACPPPRVADGYDLCPCGSGQGWPCTTPRVAWLARGLDRDVQGRAALAAAEAELVGDDGVSRWSW